MRVDFFSLELGQIWFCIPNESKFFGWNRKNLVFMVKNVEHLNQTINELDYKKDFIIFGPILKFPTIVY